MDEYIAETIEHKGLTIKIIQDPDARDPRTDCDYADTMVCFHKRYDLGDKDHGYDEGDYSNWDELARAIEEREGPLAVILPLRLLDHSGISMSVGSGAHWCDPGGWDSGQVGVIFVTKRKAIEEWGKSICTEAVRDKADKYLRQSVEAYNQYLTGDVYGYVIEDEDGVELSSLWSMFGLDYCRKEALAEAERTVTARSAEAMEPAGDVPLSR